MLMVLLAAVIAVSSWFALPIPWARLIIRLGRKYAGLQSKTVQIDGLQWHYLEGGSGPVLLLLHGFGGDADNWLKIAPYLVKRFRVIAPDLPGFGDTDRPQDNEFNIETQLRRLQSFLDQVEVAPEIVGGNSMGGWLATAYTSVHQETLSGLWLLAPLGVRAAKNSPMLEAIDKNVDNPLQIMDVHAFTNRVLEPMFGRLPWVPYPLRIYYGKQAVRRSTTAAGDFKRVLSSTASLENLAPLIRIPVLLQWGNKDFAVDVSGAGILKNRFQDVTVQVQPNVGHLPMLETPRASHRFFTAFYSQCVDHALTRTTGQKSGNVS